MKLLLAAYRLQQARPVAGVLGVHLFADEPLHAKDSEWRRMLAPWAAWTTVHPARPVASLNSPEAAADAGIRPGDAVVVLTTDTAAGDRARQAAEGAGAWPLATDWFPPGSRDADLLREVLHFDFEYGGLNEFDGAATRYGATCLQQLSATHCRNFYPRWALGAAVEAGRAAGRLPLKTLDIGCGPVSLLRWGALTGELVVTGVDPLLPMYAVVLARHGYDALPCIRCHEEIAALAEDLDRVVPAGTFDVVYTRNALDHTLRPGQVMDQVGHCLAPGGLAIVEVATREGTRQQWDQLHQTDIFVRDGAVVYCHKDGIERPLLTGTSGLRLRHMQVNSAEWLACTFEKE